MKKYSSILVIYLSYILLAHGRFQRRVFIAREISEISSSPSTEQSSPTQSLVTVPTNQPSYEETHTPSISSYPSIIPSSSPTSVPTTIPSFTPSQIPSLSSVPSTIPSHSVEPSSKPTVSAQPTLFPSTSTAPSRERNHVDISMFVVEILSKDVMDFVDTEEITKCAEIFLGEYLKTSLPQESNFIKILLHRIKSDERRRLNVSMSLVYTGRAIFDSDIYPKSTEIDDIILEAFTTHKHEFLSILQNHGNKTFAKVVRADAISVRAEKPYLSISTTVVIVLVSMIVGSVIIKLNIDFVMKKRLKKVLNQSDLFHTNSHIQHTGGANLDSNVQVQSIDVNFPFTSPMHCNKEKFGMHNDDARMIKNKYNRDNTEDVELDSAYFTNAHTRQY